MVIKPFATTGVLERKREWLRRVWPLDETCRAILDGKFYFPARPGGVNPVMRPNLRSVEEDKPLLYKIEQAARHTAGGELARDVYGRVVRFFRRPRGLSPSTPSPTRREASHSLTFPRAAGAVMAMLRGEGGGRGEGGIFSAFGILSA